MSKRKKVIPCVVQSREGMEAVVSDIVRLKLMHVEMTAQMEQEIANIQKQYQEALLDMAHQIERKEAGVYVFCRQHRRELFKEKKSLDLLLGVVGFREHPPSVAKVASKDTWGAIAMRLEAMDWGQPYIVYPDPEVNKRAILTDRTKLLPEQLEAAGIKIEQDETFYIEPKSDVIEGSKQ